VRFGISILTIGICLRFETWNFVIVGKISNVSCAKMSQSGSVENPAWERGTGTFFLRRLRKNVPVPGGVFYRASQPPVGF
jgi:hypothetical protein